MSWTFRAVPALEAWLSSLDGQLSEVDLSGVTFFDSCALSTFLTVRRRDDRMRIVNPSPAVVKVLEITGTIDYLVQGRSAGCSAHDEEEFSDIERRIRKLCDQYPNSQESVLLHRRLARYKQDPAYQLRFRTALTMLTKIGFKTGRRTEGLY
ncbi:MAG: STAS domain-containing protein [Acidimicrobiales bacterium]